MKTSATGHLLSLFVELKSQQTDVVNQSENWNNSNVTVEKMDVKRESV
jgi:hypothetical protein